MSGYKNMDDVRRANATRGGFWFSPPTLRFFSSRVSSVLHGGRYFVTSERCLGESRRYTVRIAEDGGFVNTVGEFQEFASHKAAMRRAAYLAR